MATTKSKKNIEIKKEDIEPENLPIIDHLTPEQEAMMHKFRDEWRAIGLATGPANMDVVVPIINDFYKRIGKKEPAIFHVRSPLEAHYVVGFLRNEDTIRSLLGNRTAMDVEKMKNLVQEIGEVSHNILDILGKAADKVIAAHAGDDLNLDRLRNQNTLDEVLVTLTDELFRNIQSEDKEKWAKTFIHTHETSFDPRDNHFQDIVKRVLVERLSKPDPVPSE